MTNGRQGARLPRGAVAIGLVLVAGAVWFLAASDDGGEADYRLAVERFGAPRIDRLMTSMMPLGIVKHCHDRFGEDPDLIDAVAVQVERTLPATQALVTEFETIGQMSEGEKLAIEAEVMRRVETLIANIADCDRAIERIADGEFDPPGDAAAAQSPGA